jgi:DNA-binding transcriptional MerR regulator/uncharacterized glyoxalase superfamily protein PhnB
MAGKRVGEVAKAAGLTVRTLHYYDEIGLLVPSERSDVGHRRYSAADLDRLYRITRLRGIGMTLEDIRHALDDPSWNLSSALARHIAQLDRDLAAGHRVRQRLSALASSVSAEPQDFLDLLEEMTMTSTPVRRRIPVLVYADIESAHRYLVDVFGMEAGRLSRDESGVVYHAEVNAGDGVIWLHRVAPEFGLDTPASAGVETAGLSIVVDDVDAHFRHAKAAGAEIMYGPDDMPYGVREYGVRDPEKRSWSFMTPLD